MLKTGSLSEDEIKSTGYVVHTLEAALWCFLNTDSYEECVLKAVNLGDDTDTTGCVAGGLAGVLYGTDAIPAEWIAALPRQDDLTKLFQTFIGKMQKPSEPNFCHLKPPSNDIGPNLL